MPCPELAFTGLNRFWAVKEQLDTTAYRRHCRRLAAAVAGAVEVHVRRGEDVIVVGIEGSPSMGVQVTSSDPTRGGRPEWPDGSSELSPGAGIFMEELVAELTGRGVEAPRQWASLTSCRTTIRTRSGGGWWRSWGPEGGGRRPGVPDRTGRRRAGERRPWRPRRPGSSRGRGMGRDPAARRTTPTRSQRRCSNRRRSRPRSSRARATGWCWSGITRVCSRPSTATASAPRLRSFRRARINSAPSSPASTPPKGRLREGHPACIEPRLSRRPRCHAGRRNRLLRRQRRPATAVGRQRGLDVRSHRGLAVGCRAGE